MPNEVKYWTLEDLAHNPKLAEALGNMLVAWAHAEIMLYSTFARATGIGLNMAMESSAQIPTFASRVKFILTIIREWQTDTFDKDAIATAVERLAELSTTRNHWVHGDWCANGDKTETIIFNHRKSPDSQRRRTAVEVQDVMEHCAAVRQRAKELGSLIKWGELTA